MTFADALKRALGPILSLADTPDGITFSGNYTRWKDARDASSGYDAERILRKVRESARKVRDGEAAWERDSVLFPRVEYSWPVLAGLLWVAARRGGRLRLVDFGGGLGTSYYQNRKFLAGLAEIRWSIVEQSAFAACGREEFTDEHLTFHEDLEACVSSTRPDAILLSGVLQYLESPHDLLTRVNSLGLDTILVDRTPFLLQGEDRLTVQAVPPGILEGSYPCWFLNRDGFLAAFSDAYELTAEFDGFEKANIPHSAFRGFLFRRNGGR